MNTWKTDIENGQDEIEIEADFDYEPEEPMERHYPGCSESAVITEVRIADTDIELCLLPDEQEKLEEKLLEWIADERDYANYGYMLD